jgi:hypothetical protein
MANGSNHIDEEEAGGGDGWPTDMTFDCGAPAASDEVDGGRRHQGTNRDGRAIILQMQRHRHRHPRQYVCRD